MENPKELEGIMVIIVFILAVVALIVTISDERRKKAKERYIIKKVKSRSCLESRGGVCTRSEVVYSYKVTDLETGKVRDYQDYPEHLFE